MTGRVLIVIDVQNEYFPGGKWALPGAEAALPNIATLIARARERGEAVVFVQHVLPEGAPVFATGTPGVELHPGLEVREGESLIRKTHPSSFHGTELDDFLARNAVKALDVCGFMTQMCCDATTREAFSRELGVRLYSDATAARELTVDGGTIPHDTVHRVSLGALASFARILKTAEDG